MDEGEVLRSWGDRVCLWPKWMSCIFEGSPNLRIDRPCTGHPKNGYFINDKGPGPRLVDL